MKGTQACKSGRKTPAEKSLKGMRANHWAWTRELKPLPIFHLIFLFVLFPMLPNHTHLGTIKIQLGNDDD